MGLIRKITLRLAWVGICCIVCLPLFAQDPTDAPSSNSGTSDTNSQPPDNSSSSADPETMLPHPADTRFWLSGQANFIFQAHPEFHAPFSGQNSLNPNYEKATSR